MAQIPDLFPYLIGAGVLATTVVLILGVIALARSGGSARGQGMSRSNKLMRLRVLLQALTVMLLVLFAVFFGTA